MSSPTGSWAMMRSMTKDGDVLERRLAPGTTRRVLAYGRPHRARIALLLGLVLLDAAIVVATPLLLGVIVDDGVATGDRRLVVTLAVVVALLGIADAVVSVALRWCSATIGEGLIYDLRTEVFDHVLAQPIAFFTRAQTGALVSRINSDVIGAQQAFTSTLTNVVSNAVTVTFIVVALATKSWVLTLLALALVPLFTVPARYMGKRLAGLQRESMSLNAELGTRMTERFNVAGALLVKIYGDPHREHEGYAERAARVRAVGVKIAMNRTIFLVSLGLVAALATALVYGAGGVMAIGGSLTVGSLLAMAALLGRLYGPLTQLSNVRVDVMTALVSFERVFEVLDLPPLVREAEHPVDLPDGPLGIELDDVRFAYPSADAVSLRSLETGSSSGDRTGGGEILRGVSFSAPPGALVALVGPSGAGKTTIASLVTRFYDPSSGSIRLGGVDLREVATASLRSRVKTVTQDAHLFHDTIRANLEYARPGATEQDLWSALKAAHVSALVRSLPDGLDTVVGDRGHRLSGGEKQRLAIARLLLTSPSVVVLDEATAHLDSESEVAVQRALDSALSGRTALVIAHRLSTIRQADVILVVDGGRIVQRGTHDELLAAGGLYASLYRTQFAE